MKFSLLTLGCDKNTVDSERYVAQLTDYGAEFTTDIDEAEVIVVNTCGFIDAAKKVAAAIKDAKLKKVQAAIQGEQVRVSSPSRDDLQDAIALLRSKDFGVELKFGNYR